MWDKLTPADIDDARLNHVTTDDILLRLFAYWTIKRGDRHYPSSSDLDLLEFRFAIGSVSLIDVLTQPRRYRYRLVSTKLTNRLGYEMTGKYVDEIPDAEVRRYVEALYTRATNLRVPLYEKSSRIFEDKKWKHEALLLPLSSDGELIDMLMVYRTTYDPELLPIWARTHYRNLPWS
jgi:hypothetical protein